eukprot:s4_g18.t1
MNRLVHSAHGHGPPKGKGRGKFSQGKNPPSVAAPPPNAEPTPAIETTDEIRMAVQALILDAAKIRAQITLVLEEWSVPVVPWQSLGKDNAIAVVPKQALTDVIKNVGFSGKSVAAVLTEKPDRLGLVGYDRQYLRVALSAMGAGGERIQTSAMRYVVQLGWGRPASLIMTEIERHVPGEAVGEVQPRQNETATFLLHSDYTDHILKQSGKHSVFYKEVNPVNEFLLLWCDEGTNLQGAVKMADHEDCFGVVRKGSSATPRYAVRFRSREALSTFATAHGLYDASALGRWKISGIDAAVGTFGPLAFLTKRGFADLDILYVDDGYGVFLASTPGDFSSGFFVQSDTRRQFHFKALNNVARDQARKTNENAQASSMSVSKTAPKQSQRAIRQQTLMANLQNAGPKASPKKDPNKRKAEAKSGVTPDSKKTEDPNV